MYEDPIVAQKIREALEKPVEERAPLDLPKLTPVDQLEHSRLKPAPAYVKKCRVPK